jgi:NAD+ diphosphatase
VPHTFSSNPFDRAPSLRANEDWLRAQREDPRGRYLPLRELHVAVSLGERRGLAWVERSAASSWADVDDLILLGLLNGVPHFTAAIDPAADLAFEGIEFSDARGVSTELAAEEAGVLAQARSMLAWHAEHRFCGQCGAPTQAVHGGARRLCQGCGTRHYPHVSPSMIVLVERGDFCLLARRPRGIPTRYSCLAGYVEPGESIEDATVREVLEEAGVRIGNVTYHSSQPWPFPATLMVGCFAQAESDEVTVDGVEIAEARWFSRDEVRLALAGENTALTVPDRVAIAHHLIRAWADAS